MWTTFRPTQHRPHSCSSHFMWSTFRSTQSRPHGSSAHFSPNKRSFRGPGGGVGRGLDLGSRTKICVPQGGLQGPPGDLPWPPGGLPWPPRGLPWPLRGFPWPPVFSRGLPWLPVPSRVLPRPPVASRAPVSSGGLPWSPARPALAFIFISASRVCFRFVGLVCLGPIESSTNFVCCHSPASYERTNQYGNGQFNTRCKGSRLGILNTQLYKYNSSIQK